MEKKEKMEKIKTYDIVNAGSESRFLANRRIVSNSGRLIQAQNMPATHMQGLEQARELLKQGNFEALEMLYPCVLDVLSQLIRTAFIPSIPSEGSDDREKSNSNSKNNNNNDNSNSKAKKLIVADFSSIEALVLGWLAGEQWVLDAYSKGEDLYIKNVERMFNAPVGSVDKKSPLRQKSKIAVLACGYQGSVGALKAFGATKMGIAEKDLQGLVDAWRSANPAIVKYWWDCDRAARTAVTDKTTVIVGNGNGEGNTSNQISFIYDQGLLFIELPSGRRLAYQNPRLGTNRFGSECITYEGIVTGKKWGIIESSPGKWVENITQAVARDLLYHAMHTLRKYQIVMHVHDEIVIEADSDVEVRDICKLMSRVPDWAEGLPLEADGFECNFYKKD